MHPVQHPSRGERFRGDVVQSLFRASQTPPLHLSSAAVVATAVRQPLSSAGVVACSSPVAALLMAQSRTEPTRGQGWQREANVLVLIGTNPFGLYFYVQSVDCRGRSKENTE